MSAEDDEDVARLINGLIEAGDLLMLHVQRIDFDPRAANMARECWLESRAKVSGDEGPKHWPEDAPTSHCWEPDSESGCVYRWGLRAKEEP